MRRVYNLITENLHYKLLALIFAVLLWFLATNKEVTEAVLTVKYVPVSTGDYKVVDYSPKKLKLKIEGYRRDILQLKEDKVIKVVLPGNLSAENGWIILKLRKEYVKLPISIKVKKISPERIRVRIEKLVRKAVPIKPQLEGLRRGVVVRVKPNYAVIALPEELSEASLSVETEKVDVSDVKLPAEIEVKLKSNYKVEPKRVEIILEAGDEGKEKAVRNRWNQGSGKQVSTNP